MKTTRQLLVAHALLLGTLFILVPTLSLAAVAEQPSVQQPERIIPTDPPLAVATEETKVTLTGCDTPCCESGTSGCCDCCEAVCCPKRVEKEVKKHCWNVKSKLVCIPRFRWPWERCDCGSSSCDGGCDGGCECKRECCPPLCGRTRCINVLEKHEYECQECGYEWEVKCIRCKSRTKCDGNRCCPDCGGSSCCDQ